MPTASNDDRRGSSPRERAPARGKHPLRGFVVATWPMASKWPEETWTIWRHELAGFHNDDLLNALRRIARRGSEYPPGWGAVYAEALHDRIARQAEERDS